MTTKRNNLHGLAAGFGLGLIFLTALAATVQTITLENVKDWPSATPLSTDKILGVTNGTTARLFTISALPFQPPSASLSNIVSLLLAKMNASVALTNLNGGNGSGLTNLGSGVIVTNLTGTVTGGTATTPTFATDLGTGIFKSATNVIGFATDGTERWVINSSGSLVPVGTVDIGNGIANPRDIIATRQFAVGLTNGVTLIWTNLIPGVLTQRLATIGGILFTNETISY